MRVHRRRMVLFLGVISVLLAVPVAGLAARGLEDSDSDDKGGETLSLEQVSGDGVWMQQATTPPLSRLRVFRAKVWFDRQFLGDGASYLKRAAEFSKRGRRDLRAAVARTLKSASDESFAAAEADLDKLIEDGAIRDVERHWIINGFSCTIAPDALDELKKVKGVKKIFLSGQRRQAVALGKQQGEPPAFQPVEREAFDPDQYKHPWYIRYLLADKVWKEFGVAGKGTLNVIHDFNFVLSDNTTINLYRNLGETPANGKDDDQNGLVDDYHGYNFDRNTAVLTTRQLGPGQFQGQVMHGFMCSAIICGAGVKGKEYEFGIAPEASWTGVMGSQRLEAAVEWAIEQGADTYSMSFSIPRLGEYRSHWRKIMEHGSFCGVFFVSGAGNFAQQVSTPVQMRVPEDIPDVVFAAAGVQRNFQRTLFSSKGPVEWETEHYHDGLVQKPEVCAFNMALPVLMTDGTVRPAGMNGNSFAGPMFCGAIALMLSADPDLLPWDLKQIITTTATDVAAPGVDYETGHGLINCYRAVREVLRRKAVRDGGDPSPYEGRQPGDTVDVKALQAKLEKTFLKVGQVLPGSQAARAGMQPGDIVVSYGGKGVATRQDLILARKEIVATEDEKVTMVVTRDGETHELKMGPGQFGFVPVAEFDDPVFE
ncbi:MAG: S8 family serine peptidase [Planctomycetes bacterium]|nr:S8 family serine peptidase [Planctomycetota bacterium]MBL7037916.1 S8 family serine peptidase [Pirellulaceae bacterium]